MTKCLEQYAALPLMGSGDRIQVLLVTSRGTGRWIIPKGHPERKMKPCEVAAMEAFEEAGVSGTVAKAPLGHYRSTKQLSSGKVLPCEVEVFRLDVTDHHPDWKEDHQRKRLWIPLFQAARFVEDGGLTTFLETLRL